MRPAIVARPRFLVRYSSFSRIAGVMVASSAAPQVFRFSNILCLPVSGVRIEVAANHAFAIVYAAYYYPRQQLSITGHLGTDRFSINKIQFSVLRMVVSGPNTIFKWHLNMPVRLICTTWLNHIHSVFHLCAIIREPRERSYGRLIPVPGSLLSKSLPKRR